MNTLVLLNRVMASTVNLTRSMLFHMSKGSIHTAYCLIVEIFFLTISTILYIITLKYLLVEPSFVFYPDNERVTQPIG